MSNIDGRQAEVTIEGDQFGGNAVKLSVDQYGHLWHLLSNGTVTVTVSVEGFLPMTKLVRVFTASFTEVDFNLPYAPGLPRAITALALTSFILCILLCSLLVHCRHGKAAKKSLRSSYEKYNFQLLSREERHIFDDQEDLDEDDFDEELDIFDKSVEQFGLKMPPTKVYRDVSSSDSEVEDAFLKVSRNQNDKWQL